MANQEALIRELADILAWLSALRGSGDDVSIRSWCEWKIETEEGVRASIPTTKPPPAHDLPDVSNLMGVTRDRILAEFSEPFAGCWLDRAGTFSKEPCSGLSLISYQFYDRPPAPGGGDELELEFDSAGFCVRARWVSTQ